MRDLVSSGRCKMSFAAQSISRLLELVIPLLPFQLVVYSQMGMTGTLHIRDVFGKRLSRGVVIIAA